MIRKGAQVFIEGDTLELIYDGYSWHELTRSRNSEEEDD